MLPMNRILSLTKDFVKLLKTSARFQEHVKLSVRTYLFLFVTMRTASICLLRKFPKKINLFKFTHSLQLVMTKQSQLAFENVIIKVSDRVKLL